MTTIPASHSGHCGPSSSHARKRVGRLRRQTTPAIILVLGAALVLSTLVFAQGQPKVTGVDPQSGKVNDSITVMGTSLAKDSVAAVFLSDEKTDFKATIVNQAADKIVVKVPAVKPGGYNVSIQVGNGILIEPIRFTVQ
jgi:hypothetical protein